MMPVFLELMRPLNCLMAGTAAMIGLVVVNPQFEGMTALLVFFTVFLITGAGNGVNDYFDREINLAVLLRHRTTSPGITRLRTELTS